MNLNNPNFERFVARSLIRRNVRQYCSQAIGMFVCHELKLQREIVARRGYCDGLCQPENLIESICGEVVCRWTCEPCVSRGLEAIVKQYSIINGRTKDVRQADSESV